MISKDLQRKPRLVVLNKVDLVTPRIANRAQAIVEDAGLECVATSAKTNRNLAKVREWAVGKVPVKHATLGLWMLVVGVPNIGKSSLINGMKRLAFSAAKHSRPSTQMMHGVKRTEAKAGVLPGITRHTNFVQISNRPKLYIIDSPGVMLLKDRRDPEQALKLAALGCLPDHIAGEMYIGDYLLWHLNRVRLFNYVDALQLPGPSNDIKFVAAHAAAKLQMISSRDHSPDVVAGVRVFNRMWRTGQLGKVCLDHLPEPGEEEDYRSLRPLAKVEPPGPWGPECYPGQNPERPRGV